MHAQIREQGLALKETKAETLSRSRELKELKETADRQTKEYSQIATHNTQLLKMLQAIRRVFDDAEIASFQVSQCCCPVPKLLTRLR